MGWTVRLAAAAMAAIIPAMAMAQVVDASAVRETGGVEVTWQTATPGEAVDLFRQRSDDGVVRLEPLSISDRDGQHLVKPRTTHEIYVLKARTGAFRVAERLLPLAGVANFRDVGGYQTDTGRFVKWGMIYRSAQLSDLQESDILALRALGIGLIYDLRSREEKSQEPTAWIGAGAPPIKSVDYSTDYSAFAGAFSDGIDVAEARDLMAGFYREMGESHKAQFRAIFAELLDEDVSSVLYHCTAGKDRTGATTALILTALGVSREVVTQDFLLSNQHYAARVPTTELDSNGPFARLPMDVKQVFMGVDRRFLDAMFSGIEQRYGSVDAYLQTQLGVGPAERARLRLLYTE